MSEHPRRRVVVYFESMAVDVRLYRELQPDASAEWERLVTCDQPLDRIDYTAELPTAPVVALALRQSADLPPCPIHVSGFPW